MHSSLRERSMPQLTAAEPTPRSLRPSSRLPEAGLAAAVGAGVAALTVLRLVVAGPGLDRVWAEDGFIFLWDARRHGLASLGYVYAGYAHTAPRAWSIVGAQLPLEQFALFAVLATALTAGVLAAVVFRVARRVTGSTAWAVLPALALALAPAFRGSVGSLANLQWLLIAAAFWCVIDRTGNRWIPAVTALAAALTTPLVALLLPAAWLAHRRDVLRSRAVWGLGTGLVVQAALIAFGNPSAANPAVRHPGLSESLVGATLTAAFGSNQTALELGRLGTLDGALLIGALVAAVVVVALYEVRGQRTLATTAVLTGLLLFAATSFLNGAPATRYAGAAAMLIFSGLALAGPRLPRPVQLTAVGLLALNALWSFPASDYRLSGPSWDDQVARYEQSCLTDGEPTPMELSPEGWGRLGLDCPS